ncbi:FABP family protein [Actinopolyspora erythraea]|uniref:Ferric nitrobindin-like protein n=1 Tax=Actinopolyspora erythraea TaxID=414996 RepID=A0A099DAF1_9ACTN|nr:FABP family protein [Actinopolyspora erythraea]ASU80450.1 FABP family protein [Actinopolyspora erythraea]KGI82881.1 fatty acid-binding protein [Actinopolyspora erythraea]
MSATPNQPSEQSGPSNGQPQPGSGDAAVRAQAERAEKTRGRNIPEFDDLPGIGDTANLRMGPELNGACLGLLPLIGVWRGEGEANHPSLDEKYRFLQQVTFAHDGRPFLYYESRAWKLDGEGGEIVEPAFRELGWWRPQPDDSIELLLVHSSGIAEMFFGNPRNQTSWELSTDAVLRTPTSEDVTAATRLYGVVEGSLAYVEERATSEHELQPRLSAKLERVVG